MTTTQRSKFGNWIKTSITARMLMVGFLILVLLIPLSFIKDLIRERTNRQESVINEINSKWGNELLLYGPVLRIPYRTFSETIIKDKSSKRVRSEIISTINYAYFFPNDLEINGTVNPEEKSRGIYKTAVYKSNISLSGSFSTPDFSEIDVLDKNILWDKAKVIIKTSNLKGVNSRVKIKFNKTEYAFNSKYNGDAQQNNPYSNSNHIALHNLESKSLALSDSPKDGLKTFNMELNTNGSKQIRFIPIGKETTVNIKSDWKTANFIGYFLPQNSDKITKNGFNAKWKALDVNRPFPQQFFKTLPDLTKYALGVNFMIPVDEYQKSERSAKYGILVISLTFLVFFLIQTLSKIPIHSFQYLMIGIALVMFYILLISISEHSNFLKAYLIAGSAVIVLITLYSRTILQKIKFPVFIGLSLTTLYAFIFVIIQLENYALIVGSIGLFAILAIVMFVSRKIDWQND